MSGRHRFFFVLPEHCWQNDADSGFLLQGLLWRLDPLPYDGGDGFLAGGGGHGGGGFGGPFDVVVLDVRETSNTAWTYFLSRVRRVRRVRRIMSANRALLSCSSVMSPFSSAPLTQSVFVILVGGDERQIVLPFPLSHRKRCGRNRRPAAHCGLHRPQLRAFRPANSVIKGRFPA